MSQITAESELKRANVLNEFVTGLFENARHGQPRESVPTTRELLLRGCGDGQNRVLTVSLNCSKTC